jgi:TPR repeat protein
VDLAHAYEDGSGVTMDANQCFELHLSAARQNLRMGWRALGSCYFEGTGIEASWRQARKCWKMALQSGDKVAERLLLRTDHLEVALDDNH